METVNSILKGNDTLTPYKFYTEFLVDVAKFYSLHSGQVISFKLFEKGDEGVFDTFYKIDPIVIPLLLSLFEQLSKYHKAPLELHLNNNRATIPVLEFLFRSDFFKIIGQSSENIRGRNIIKYEKAYLGLFEGKNIRSQHRVRAYSLKDVGVQENISKVKSEENKRDFLISHYTYQVREHFEDLLFENEFTAEIYNIYIDILSELIANSVLHSKSDAYALMFVDRFKTKFSISDNGIGFEGSMQLKDSNFYYSKGIIKKNLSEHTLIANISSSVLENLYTIFETLYFSSLKDRRGIFDLMVTVVLESNGYFRIHSDNCQIIISNRMADDLVKLKNIRKDVYKLHTDYLLNVIPKEFWQDRLTYLSKEMQNAFVSFYQNAAAKYSTDIRYSSLRFYNVKFRGVHIEVEIPNNSNHDYLRN